MQIRSLDNHSQFVAVLKTLYLERMILADASLLGFPSLHGCWCMFLIKKRNFLFTVFVYIFCKCQTSLCFSYIFYVNSLSYTIAQPSVIILCIYLIHVKCKKGSYCPNFAWLNKEFLVVLNYLFYVSSSCRSFICDLGLMIQISTET
jgi:hypothetical protein